MFCGFEGWLKDDLRYLSSLNPCIINDRTPCFVDLLFGLSVQASLGSTALQDGKGHRSQQQHPGHQNLSGGESSHNTPPETNSSPLKIGLNAPKGHYCSIPTIHFQVLCLLVSGRVSHSHVSRIIHGNQDRLGIPCWEDLVSLGANASIQRCASLEFEGSKRKFLELRNAIHLPVIP